MKNTLRPALGALALAGMILTAQPALSQTTSQVCFSDQIPLTTTNWSSTVTIPKFDPTLGDLVSIAFTLAGDIQGTAKAESLDTSPTQVNTQFSATITLTRPDLSTIVVSIPIATFVDDFTSFDGTLDFRGTSGVTHSGINATDSQTVNSPPPTSDLALFTGTGNILLPVSAAGSSVATGSGNLITQFQTAADATVTVCYNYIPNVPPVLNCPGTVMASVGVPLSFQICASDSEATDTVTLTSTALPAGMTATPTLPTSGNPVCTTIDWTPTSGQVGTTTVTFTATDGHMRSTSCTVTIVAAECHVLFSMGPGNTQATIFGHTYDTQLAGVRRSFPVTLANIPTFGWNDLPPAIFVQLVMYNPLVFPSNPSQWSQAMMVVKNPNHTLTTQYSGTGNGISIRAEVYTLNGAQRVRFPFRIQGMGGW